MVSAKKRRQIVAAINKLESIKRQYPKGHKVYKDLSYQQKVLREKLYPPSARRDIELKRKIRRGEKKIVKTGKKKYKVVDVEPKEKYVPRGGFVTAKKPKDVVYVKPKEELTTLGYRQKIYAEQYKAATFTSEALSTAEILRATTFEPAQWYKMEMPSGKVRIMSGAEAQVLFLREAERLETQGKELSGIQQELMKQYHQAGEWDPKTKVVSYDPFYYRVTKKGKLKAGPTKGVTGPGGIAYLPKFKYPGAEKYSYYKKHHFERPWLTALGTAFTKENIFGIPAAYYTITGEKKKAIDIQIKGMHYLESRKKEGLLGFGRYLLESPYVQVGTATAMMAPVGAGLGYTGAYLGGKSALAVAAFKTAQLGTGGFFVGMAGGQVAKTYGLRMKPYKGGIPDFYVKKKTKPGEALGQIGFYGAIFAGGIYGAKAGSQYVTKTGLTWGERGFIRGYTSRIHTGIAKGTLEPDVGEAMLQALRSRAYILGKSRIARIKPYQPEPRWGAVRTLKPFKGLRTYFRQKFLRIKHELFGGVATDKPVTHDLDAMLHPKQVAYSKYAAKQLTGREMDTIADFKPFQRVGEPVGRMYEYKMPSYVTKAGYKEMRYLEQFARLSSSGIETPASRVRWDVTLGRYEAKDIPEALRMLGKLYPPGTASPEMKSQIDIFTKAFQFLGKQPQIMPSAEEQYLFGSGFRDVFFKARVKFYEKIIPESMFKADVMKYSHFIKTTPLSGEISYLPPSPKVPSPAMWAVTAVSPFFAISPKPTVSLMVHPSSRMDPFGFVRLYLKSPRFGTRGQGYSQKWYPSNIYGVSPSISPSRISPSPPSVAPSFAPSISPSISFSLPSIISPSISPSYSPYSPPSPSPSYTSIFPSSPSPPSPSPPSPSYSYPSPSPSVSPSSILPSSPYFLRWLPRPSMEGMGTRGFDFAWFGKQVKYREVKIPSPFQGLGL